MAGTPTGGKSRLSYAGTVDWVQELLAGQQVVQVGNTIDGEWFDSNSDRIAELLAALFGDPKTQVELDRLAACLDGERSIVEVGGRRKIPVACDRDRFIVLSRFCQNCLYGFNHFGRRRRGRKSSVSDDDRQPVENLKAFVLGIIESAWFLNERNFTVFSRVIAAAMKGRSRRELRLSTLQVPTTDGLRDSWRATESTAHLVARNLIQDVDRLLTLQLSEATIGKPKIKRDNGKTKMKEPARKASVNVRMLAKIQTNHNAMGWNSTQWAEQLKCAKSTVVVTPTWKDLGMRRDRERAERAKDRRHNRKPLN